MACTPISGDAAPGDAFPVTTRQQDIGRSGTHEVVRSAVVVGALGVVFGDIGTSPIYTLQTVFNAADPHPIPVSTTNVYGVVSPNRLPAVGVAWHRDLRPNCGDLADSEPTDGALHRRALGPPALRPGFLGRRAKDPGDNCRRGIVPVRVGWQGVRHASSPWWACSPSALEATDAKRSQGSGARWEGSLLRQRVDIPFRDSSGWLFMGQGYVAVVLAL